MKADVNITDIHRLIFQNTKTINFLVNQRREECAIIRQKKVKLTQTQIGESYLSYLAKYKKLVFQHENYVGED